MADFLSGLLGPYFYQFILQGIAVLQILLTTWIFALPLPRKAHYVPRLLLSLAVAAVILWFSIVLRTHSTAMLSRVVVSLLQYSLALPMLHLCYAGTVFSGLQTWCMSVAASEATGCIYWGFLTLMGTDTAASVSLFGDAIIPLDWVVYWGLHLLCYAVLYRLFGRTRILDSDPKDVRDMAILSVTSVLLQIALTCISSEYRSQSASLFAMTRLYNLSMSLLVLVVGSYIVKQHQQRAETALMEQTLRIERQQYERMKGNIDLINMRCHDLKHQLEGVSERLTAEEVRSLQEAISIYDSTVKTGSEVLDVLIYEKQLLCQQDGILLTCMADGKALAFMRTRHVYALFDNALSNAIEAVRKLEDPEKRVIGLHVAQKQGMVEISVTNYFAGTIQLDRGLPTTSKSDKNRHGFGTMSIRYIAEQYHGTMQIEAKNAIYTLTIHIPQGRAGQCPAPISARLD